MALGAERQDIVAITAAMMHPVGLHTFQARFPERTFDVGIAEQHAVTSAAGLAMAGLHPVVAIYATFLNRAFDQVLMDVALHRCGVTFVLDRAGVTGDDGASHNGMWDMSILQVVPGLRLAAPRDGARVRELLREAVDVDDAPTVLRLPKGPPPDDIPAVGKAGGADVLVRKGAADVLLVAVGSMAAVAVDVADRLGAQGIGVTVVDPRWVKPVDPAIVELAARPPAGRQRGGQRRDRRLRGRPAADPHGAGVTTPFRLHGIPQEFLDHAKRDRILERIGLTPQALARGIVEAMSALPDPTVATGRGRHSGRCRQDGLALRVAVAAALLLSTAGCSLFSDDEPEDSAEPSAVPVRRHHHRRAAGRACRASSRRSGGAPTPYAAATSTPSWPAWRRATARCATSSAPTSPTSGSCRWPRSTTRSTRPAWCATARTTGWSSTWPSSSTASTTSRSSPATGSASPRRTSPGASGSRR